MKVNEAECCTHFWRMKVNEADLTFCSLFGCQLHSQKCFPRTPWLFSSPRGFWGNELHFVIPNASHTRESHNLCCAWLCYVRRTQPLPAAILSVAHRLNVRLSGPREPVFFLKQISPNHGHFSASRCEIRCPPPRMLWRDMLLMWNHCLTWKYTSGPDCGLEPYDHVVIKSCGSFVYKSAHFIVGRCPFFSFRRRLRNFVCVLKVNRTPDRLCLSFVDSCCHCFAGGRRFGCSQTSTSCCRSEFRGGSDCCWHWLGVVEPSKFAGLCTCQKS